MAMIQQWCCILVVVMAWSSQAFLMPKNPLDRSQHILPNPKIGFRLVHRSERKSSKTKLFTSDMNNPEEDDDEEDCENEDECEIDWDSMPGFGGDETAPTTNDDDSTASMRNRLEMSWALDDVKDECDVFRPVTCGGSPCRVCRTSGRMACRFCHGRTYNEKLQSNCPICDERGQEVCANCRGSGWVADWTAWGMRTDSNNNKSDGTPFSSKLAP